MLAFRRDHNDQPVGVRRFDTGGQAIGQADCAVGASADAQAAADAIIRDDISGGGFAVPTNCSCRANIAAGGAGKSIESAEQRRLAVVLFHIGCATASEAASGTGAPISQHDRRACLMLVMHLCHVRAIVPRKCSSCACAFVNDEIRHRGPPEAG